MRCPHLLAAAATVAGHTEAPVRATSVAAAQERLSASSLDW